MKTIKNADQEKSIGEDRLEELSDLGEFCLFSEGRVEEDVLDKVDELDLHDVLLVQHYLTQHFEEIVDDITDQLLAKDRVVDIVQECLDELNS